MARNNKSRVTGWLVLSLSILLLSGCASYQARQAYEAGEKFSAEEKFDQAVEKYAEANALDPSSKKYKLELLSSRAKAAAQYLRQARQLTREGKPEDALAIYRQAQRVDPSNEVAVQEERQLSNLLAAQKHAEEGADLYGRKNPAAARKAIEQALKLDANNARALAIKELLDREQKKIAMDGVELDVASTEPITLRFKDANIKEVFGILSQLSGINFIFDEDIRSQSVSVLLEKASFAQAMQLIMQMNGLGKKVLNSKTIIVYPLTREKEKQYEDQLIQTFYLSHIDAKKAVNLLRTMLQLRKVYVHEERNALVVRDKPEVIRLAEQILAAADRADSEVLFELELVSVNTKDDILWGPQLTPQSIGVGMADSLGTNLLLGSLPTAGSATTGLVQSLNGLQTFYSIPSAKFDFLKTLEDSETLANPKVRVKNREKAKIHVGTREPVITGTNNNGTTTESIQYVDVGIKLDVEPIIQLDGTVLAGIKLEVSDATYLDKTDSGTTPIRITTTNAETKLVLNDGERTVIGGLFEKIDSKNKSTIPFIGQIPIIGSLFSHIDNKDRKKEILLSITPHIIKQVELPVPDIATIWSGGEDNLKAGPNFGAFAQPLLSEFEEVKPLAAPAVKLASLSLPAEAVEMSPQPVSVPFVAVPVAQEKTPAVSPAEPIAAPEPEAAPQAAPAVPATESVPTEELAPAEEVGAPLVLEAPSRLTAKLVFTAPPQVELEKEFVLGVEVRDVEKLYSAPLFIQYNPAALELISVSEGGFLKQNDHATVFSSSPNRATGQVIVGYKQGTGGKGASGSGQLFTLSFKPLARGATPVEINRVNFRSPEGVRLEVVPEAVMVEVR